MPKEEDANEQEDVESTESSEETEEDEGRMKTAAEVGAERAAARAEEAAEEGAADEETEEEAEEDEEDEDEEQEAEQGPPTAEPQRYEDSLPPVTVPDMLKTFCSVLAGQGWQKLGLVMDPTTGEIAEDLEQARLAIDTIGILIDKLEGHLTPAEKRDFDGAIANLQINFVQRRNASQEREGS